MDRANKDRIKIAINKISSNIRNGRKWRNHKNALIST